MTRPTAWPVRLMLAAWLALAGCGGSQVDVASDDLQAAMQALSEEIDALIGHATCQTTDQCRVVAVGAKPCGGPAGYRVYSTWETDPVILEDLAAQYTHLSEQWNRETNAISDCMFVTPPPVACVTGTCVAQTQ